jgi:3-oxoacyl-[acyl-carrier protein] reductase
MDIKGRNALVTGAAAGIGRAAAVAFAKKGAARIILADLEPHGLAETAAQVEKLGAKAIICKIDVTDRAAQEAMFAEAERAGGLDIVFNNAGILSGPPPFPETPIERIELLIAINFTAVIVGTWLAIRHMKKRGGGVIINTSSTGGLNPYLADAPYAATKAGVLMFSRSCGPLGEMANIRVNAVCPGVTNTPILAKTGGDKVADWLEPLLKQIKVLEPEEIASVVVGLVEDDSKSGEFVVVQNDVVGDSRVKLA